ncbi:hypothetical protein ALC57_11575 [Trachymyrmex cornetzi]|uniref:Uncharacterized protein n=1 Tax=Trachymyrmex cornetzi TaxID=471704 RepID=A0A151J2B9_9HYME|nr:hypothetical protein ALC57_11575 [Trachymyrmex cornetzi]
MLITVEEIYFYAQTSPSHRNFVEGKRVLEANHIIKIGKNTENVRSDCVSLTALCLQTSQLKQSSHEVIGEVRRNGKIMSMKCNADLGEKCKCKAGKDSFTKPSCEQSKKELSFTIRERQ